MTMPMYKHHIHCSIKESSILSLSLSLMIYEIIEKMTDC